MFLSKSQNVFGNITKCICPNHKMYLEKLQNLFGQITKCIWTNCKMYLYQCKKSKLWNVFGQGWAQEENSCCARKGNSAQCIKIKMQRAKIISLHFHWNSRKYIAVTSVQWVQCIYGSALEFHVAYIRQCIQLIVKYCDVAMTVHCINSQWKLSLFTLYVYIIYSGTYIYSL